LAVGAGSNVSSLARILAEYPAVPVGRLSAYVLFVNPADIALRWEQDPVGRWRSVGRTREKVLS
jgi:hypothetical protein